MLGKLIPPAGSASQYIQRKKTRLREVLPNKIAPTRVFLETSTWWVRGLSYRFDFQPSIE